MIETAEFQIDVSLEAAWSMTTAEEDTQRQANAEAMRRFLDRLGGAD